MSQPSSNSGAEVRRAEPAEAGPAPRWREDFPISWDRDDYVTRRELAKFLTLGSALLALVSGVIAAAARWLYSADVDGPRRRVANAASIAPGGSLLFRYPTPEDPCILVRTAGGELRAYSQTCTHLACAVVHRPDEGSLFCPCHHGHFDEQTGRPVGGPPTRPLPRIRLQVTAEDVFAVGREA
jgi:Rieske Fe-S protein